MFVEGHIYRRRDIHDLYGGNHQSGICPSAKMPYIFVFTGSTGKQHGYVDEWLNEDVFSYSGEGQVGDMEFTKGNLALREHLRENKRVFLFEYVAKGSVKFVCEIQFLDFGFYPTIDREGNERYGIKFFFRRLGERKYVIPTQLISSVEDSRADYEYKKPDQTERRGLVTSRVGQGAYRKSILHRWEYKCAATEYNDIRVLIASHIIPWKDANDEQRLDVNNGILLSPDYDALFDKKLISFESSTGKILLPTNLSYEQLKPLGITGKEQIKKLTQGNRFYLDQHNELFS